MKRGFSQRVHRAAPYRLATLPADCAPYRWFVDVGEEAQLRLGRACFGIEWKHIYGAGVSYALLSGKARASWAISHGLIPIGGERKVTRSQGNVIYEIDGKPATDVLKEYLPDHALSEDRDWMQYAISLALFSKPLAT